MAEFNRRSGGHIGHASISKFRQDNGKIWTSFVTSKGKIRNLGAGKLKFEVKTFPTFTILIICKL